MKIHRTIPGCLMLLSQLAASSSSSSEVLIDEGGDIQDDLGGVDPVDADKYEFVNAMLGRGLHEDEAENESENEEDDAGVDDVDDVDDNDGLAEIEITARQSGTDLLRMLKKAKKKSGRQGNSSGDKTKTSSQKKKRRVVVRYGNNQGLMDAMALGGQAYHHFTDDKTVILDLDDESVAYLDGWDENIQSVEDDPIWEEQGYLEEHLDESQMRKRMLQGETIPYGIKMVQADQIPMGNWPVQVCVTDTGSSRRHPDLRDANMKGASRYDATENGQVKLKWAFDNRGHGTHVAGKWVPDHAPRNIQISKVC